MRLVICVSATAALCACENPLFYAGAVPEQPTGCAPNAGAEGLEAAAELDRIVLGWTSRAVNEAGFIVERQTAGTWGEVGRTGADVHLYEDATVALDATYAYRVSTYRLDGEQECTSEPSAELAQLSRPTPVDTLDAVALSATNVRLDWTDTPVDVEVYRVYRRILGQEFTEVGSVRVGTRQFSDPGLTAGLTYDYQVTAESSAGESAPAGVSAVAWQGPSMSLGGASLDATCWLEVAGTASIGTGAQLSMAQGTIGGLDVSADGFGVAGVLPDLTASSVDVTWQLTDTQGGVGTASATLDLDRTTAVRSAARLPDPRVEPILSSGRQVLRPGCSECTGSHGRLDLGGFHGCMLVGDRARCWGANGTTQLGVERPPDELLAPSTVCSDAPGDACGQTVGGAGTALAMGGNSACALSPTGELRCWGSNSNGTLGDGTRATRGTGVRPCIEVAGQCTPLSGITAAAVASDYACAVVGVSGEVWCWGTDLDGGLGSGPPRNDSPSPRPVCQQGSHAAGDCVPLTGATEVSVGFGTSNGDHACALMSTGAVHCWGRNEAGQLGHLAPLALVNPARTCAEVTCGTPLTADSVTLGGGHGCLLSAGSVACWGNNGSGQLGDGSGQDSTFPVPVCTDLASCNALTNITKVVSGLGFSCALGSGGEVHCWGSNTYGELGDPDLSESHVAIPVCQSGTLGNGDCVPLAGALDVTAGDWHACAVTAAGEVRCWGYPSSGALGRGVTGTSNPAPVCVGAAVWDEMMCNDGMGSDDRLTGISTLAAGGDHTCALDSMQQLWCWGSNGWGQIGAGGYSTAWGAESILGSVTTFEASNDVTCAVSGGVVMCWGAGNSEQLGNDLPYIDVPTEVCLSGAWTMSSCPGGSLTGVRQLAGGDDFMCAVTTSDDVLCWGEVYEGELGDGFRTSISKNPAPVCASGSGAMCPALTGIASLDAISESVCAIRNGTNELWCWGENYNEPVPVGPGAGVAANPVVVCESGFGASCVPFSGADALALANARSCARVAGEVRCWGTRGSGGLGDGNSSGYSANPVSVCASGFWDGAACSGGMPLTGVDQIDGAGRNFCARAGADLWCWGYGVSGRLGNASSASAPNPVQPCDPAGCGSGVLSGVTDFDVGPLHSCARSAGGAVMCWGDNDSGQLSRGSTSSYEDLPGPACSDTTSGCTPWTAADIEVNDGATCAVEATTGDVRCVGDNGYAQLGVGRSDYSPVPMDLCANGDFDNCVPAAGLVDITAGQAHGCAVLADGTAGCWGWNSEGRLGAGFVMGVLPFSQVCLTGVATDGVCDEQALTNVVAIDAGGAHTCAVRGDGTVACWGREDEGQLGDGRGGFVGSEPNPQIVGCNGVVPTPGCVGPGPLSDVRGIATGGNHTCALIAGGFVKCWGDNSLGQLGDGSTLDRLLPVDVNLGGHAAASLAAGDDHTCAVLANDGRVACWGNNPLGEVGSGVQSPSSDPAVREPTLVCQSGNAGTCIPLTGAIDVSAGETFTCALMQDGTARCWGNLKDGRLGNGVAMQADGSTFSPHAVTVCAPDPAPDCVQGAYSCTPLGGLVSISAGSKVTCALHETGRAYCWGDATNGKRGDGTATNNNVSPTTCTAVSVCLTQPSHCESTGYLDDASVQTCDMVTLAP